MRASRSWLLFFSLFPLSVFADLFVLRAGYGTVEPAVLHYNEESGAFIGRFDRGTNDPNFFTGETQEGMCFGPDGNIYTTGNGLGYGQINCFDGVTGQLRSILRPSNLFRPTGLRFGNNGQLYVCGYTNLSTFGPSPRVVFVLNPNNQQPVARIPAGASYDSLYDLAVSRTGLIVVSDRGASQVMRVMPLGTSVFAAVNSPSGMTFGPDGHLYTSSFNGGSVIKVDGTNGTFLSTFVAPGSGGLARPTGISFGPDGHLYVACSASNAVFRYNGITGAFMDQFVVPGSGGLNASVAMIAFAPIPRLRAQRAGANVLIRWPAALTNFNLESASAFSGSNSWAMVTNNAAVVGRERVITNSPSANTFYRLRKE